MTGELRSGTRTLLFSDVEGSTRLLQRLGASYADFLVEHRTLLRRAFSEHGGFEHGTEGDSFFVSFELAHDAIAAALSAQLALRRHLWAADEPIKVRMGMHTGDVVAAGGGYVGMPVHEAARVAAAAHGGQVIISERTRDLVEDVTAVTWRDLGSHRLRDISRPLRLFQLCHPELDEEFPPPRTDGSVRGSNLPVQLTSLVGREREVAELAELVVERRLVTVTGAGGAGKTRIAYQVAAEVSDHFPDGVWVSELASVREPAAVMSELADAVGVSTQTSDSSESALIEQCRDRRILLVIDNCEHLIAPVAEIVAQLLKNCPSLSILTTSRELVGVQGETGWRAPPLSIPERSSVGLNELLNSDAVRLFVDRARELDSAFMIDESNATLVANIVRRLDGLPLAIELAAARTRSMSVEQLAERIDASFRLLSGSDTRALGRQRTLQATVDWSYDLLSEKEQQLFQRLAVFPGDFSLEAAEAVGAGGDIEATQVPDLLDRLVTKSLVVADVRRGRYDLLQTMRDYALDRLVASGEVQATRDQHLRWSAELAQQADQVIYADRVDEALEMIGREFVNLNAAIDWAARDGDPEMGARALSHSWITWSLFWGGHLREAEQLARRLLDVMPKDETESRLRVFLATGRFAARRGTTEVAREIIEAAVQAARSLPPSRERDASLTHALWYAAGLRRRSGDAAGADDASREAIAVASALGVSAITAGALASRAALISYFGNLQEGIELTEESVKFAQASGSTTLVAQAWMALGIVRTNSGDLPGARSAFDRAYTHARQTSAASFKQTILNAWGEIALQEHRLSEAEALFTEAVSMLRGDPHISSQAELGLGRALHLLGRSEEAKRHLLHARRLLEDLGQPQAVEETDQLLREIP